MDVMTMAAWVICLADVSHCDIDWTDHLISCPLGSSVVTCHRGNDYQSGLPYTYLGRLYDRFYLALGLLDRIVRVGLFPMLRKVLGCESGLYESQVRSGDGTNQLHSC